MSGGILVAGAGAIGSVVGGLLAAAGAPVTLLARPAHCEAMDAAGLAIEGLFGTHRVHGVACAASVEALAPAYDAILVTVKAWDTTAMLAAVAPRLARGGVIVSLQNGLGNLEAAVEAVGRDRVLGGRVIFGAEMPAPGRVRVTVCAAPVLVGAVDPARRADAAHWAARLAAAGVPAEPTDALAAELWGKVLYNAALNPLGALLDVAYGALPADPDARVVMDAVIDEAFAVARADGVELRWDDADAYRREFYQALVPPTAAHRSSMLQDLARGRPTEIDAINGWVVRRGSALGIPTPTNALLTRLIKMRVRRANTEPCPPR